MMLMEIEEGILSLSLRMQIVCSNSNSCQIFIDCLTVLVIESNYVPNFIVSSSNAMKFKSLFRRFSRKQTSILNIDKSKYLLQLSLNSKILNHSKDSINISSSIERYFWDQLIYIIIISSQFP